MNFIKRMINNECSMNRFALQIDMTEIVDVFVDGACIGNGLPFPDSGAGIGVWFGDNHHLNFNWSVTDSDCNVLSLCRHVEKHTQSNQRAEIQAAHSAITIAIREKIFALRINTDSKYVLDGITNWIKKWKRNGWINSRGNPVANKGDWSNLSNEIDHFISHGGTLEWEYVKAHSGNYGNDQADQLAKWAAKASYDYNQFMAASKCPDKCCGCPGPDASHSEQQRLGELERKMFESRKKTSLQELM